MKITGVKMRLIKAFYKFLEIFQKVARNFSKRCSNVALKRSKVPFCNESCLKNKNFFLSLLLFGLMQKYAIRTTKVTFLGIFVQFCVVTSVAK